MALTTKRSVTLLLAALWLNGCSPVIQDNSEPQSGRIDTEDNETDAINLSGGVSSVPYQKGYKGYNCFRTPALVKATDGTLLAFSGGRKGGCGDDNDSDLVLRRSTDHGKTWLDMQILDKGWQDPKNRVGLANPVVLDNGRILVLYMWNKFTKNIDDRGCRRAFLMSSDDHGKTWSKRTDITAQVQRVCREDANGRFVDPPARGEWGWTGLGPVHGIVKQFAPHKGRIVIAGRHLAQDSKTYSHVIYSDDDGASWKIGGALSKRSTESTVVELPDGRLMMNSRSVDSISARTAGISEDGGKTFLPAYIDKALTEPGGVQGSLLRFGDKILFSNPRSTTERALGTIRWSGDNGKTWKKYVTYSKRGEFSAYSDMVRVKGDIGVLYEWGPSQAKEDRHKQIRFRTIDAGGLK